MRDQTVARNYAEALFELAAGHEGVEAFGEALDGVASLIDDEAAFRSFLETPRVSAGEKKRVIRGAFEGHVPGAFLNFLLVTVDKRRQRLIREMALQYHDLLDEHLNRVQVEVTVARPVDDETRQRIASQLSKSMGKEAIPHVRVDPSILGGVVVRAGDTVFDGSLRRRMSRLRKQLLAAEVSTPGAATAREQPEE